MRLIKWFLSFFEKKNDDDNDQYEFDYSQYPRDNKP